MTSQTTEYFLSCFRPVNLICEICKNTCHTGDDISPDDQRELAVILPCAHIFGDRCIAKYTKQKKNTCPYCRRTLFQNSSATAPVLTAARETVRRQGMERLPPIQPGIPERYTRWRTQSQTMVDLQIAAEIEAAQAENAQTEAARAEDLYLYTGDWTYGDLRDRNDGEQAFSEADLEGKAYDIAYAPKKDQR